MRRNEKSQEESVSYSVNIPKSIDLDNLLVSYPITTVAKAKDYLLYILSLIPPNGNFKSLNSVKLQNIVDNYKPLITWLIERDILETSDEFKKNQKSKEYKFNKHYVTEVKKELITYRLFVRKLQRLQDLKTKASTPKIEADNVGYGYETIWWRSKQVAAELSLKPTKMIQGLIHFGLIEALPNENNRVKDSSKNYYYEVYIYSRFGQLTFNKVLFINEDFIKTIREFSIQYPSFFPKRKPEFVKRRKIS